jgi:hypothetical protein
MAIQSIGDTAVLTQAKKTVFPEKTTANDTSQSQTKKAAFPEKTSAGDTAVLTQAKKTEVPEKTSVGDSSLASQAKKTVTPEKTDKTEKEAEAETSQLTPAQKAILHPSVGTRRVDAYIPTYGSTGNTATYKP